jgi:hypothetical protein
MATEIDDLFNRISDNPYLEGTKENLDAVIAYMRKTQGLAERGDKADKVPGKKPDLVALKLLPKPEPMRRI